MSKKVWIFPIELEQLLEDLPPTEDGGATIIVHDNEEGILTLRGEQAAKILVSEAIVTRFFEALGSPSEAVVEIRGAELKDEICEAFEKLFDYVEIDD